MDYAVATIEGMYSLRILLLLREKDTMFITQIQKELGANFNTIKDRTEQLEAAKLVVSRHEEVKPFKLLISLTPKGREVAEALSEVEAALGR